MKIIKKLVACMILFLFLSIFLTINNTSAATEVHVNLASQTATTVSLSWTKTNDILFDSYAVTYSRYVNGPYTTAATIKDADTTSYSVTGLTPNTAYYFIITDTSNDIISKSTESSNCLQAYTNPVPVLSSPSKTSTTVSLKWSDYNSYSSTMPFKSYVVQMCVSGGQWSTLTTIDDYSQDTYTVTGLSPANYQFRMFDQVGTSGQYGATSNIIDVSLFEQLKVQINTPSTTSVNVGQQLQLSAQGSGGSGSYNYQWYLNGNQIYGATTAVYTFNPDSTGSYNIKCSISDAQEYSLASATSNSVTLSVPETVHGSLATPTPSVPEFPSLYILSLIVVFSAFLVIAVRKSKQS